MKPLRALALFFFVAICSASGFTARNQTIHTRFNSKHAEHFINEFEDGHEDVWAVLVSSSNTWFDYRHTSDALGVYRALKGLGMRDDHIILMLSESTACNAFNNMPGSMYMASGGPDVYGTDIEIDYREDEVNVKNFVSVLLGRHEPFTVRTKQMLSGPKSNVIIYLAGHGGAKFLKFRTDELLSGDFAQIIEQMHAQHRYLNLLTILDTCQASTLYDGITTERFMGLASSSLGENSYSLHISTDLNAALCDQMTYCLQAYINRLTVDSTNTLQDALDIRSYCAVYNSTPALVTNSIDTVSIRIIDFFAHPKKIALTLRPYL